MRKQMQGLALILFGILLMLVVLVALEDAGLDLLLLLGLVSGVAGLVFSFRKND